MNFRMATNQAGIPVIMQGAVNPPINQNQQHVVVAQTIPKTFPVRTFKICGGLQIGCGILGIIGVVLDVIMMNTKCQGDTYCGRNKGLVTSEVIYMICSGWVSFEMSMILNMLGKNDHVQVYKHYSAIIIEHIKVFIFKEEKNNFAFLYFDKY